MRAVRNRLTYANVVSTLALVVAVSTGSAYAAVTLTKGSVTTTHIKDGTIGTVDVSRTARRALAGTAGPQGARGAQGPQGVQGIQGLAGAAGSPGLSGLEIVHAPTDIYGSTIIRAVCPTGKKVIGGGAFANSSGTPIYKSYPDTDSSWYAASSGNVWAYAICASVA